PRVSPTSAVKTSIDASAKPCSEKALRAAAISLARVSSIIFARVLRTGFFFIRSVCVLTSMKCNLYFAYAAYVNSHALWTHHSPHADTYCRRPAQVPTMTKNSPVFPANRHALYEEHGYSAA